jgi:hypothetical protein
LSWLSSFCFSSGEIGGRFMGWGLGMEVELSEESDDDESEGVGPRTSGEAASEGDVGVAGELAATVSSTQ